VEVGHPAYGVNVTDTVDAAESCGV
jgi:hypothetical protein